MSVLDACPNCEGADELVAGDEYDGVTMHDEVSVQCPECGWHECSTPPLIHHSEHVCPECENRW